MRVALAYGTGTLAVDVPDAACVVAPRELPGLEDETAAITVQVRPRLKTLFEMGRPRRVVVAFPDLTRPMPNRTVLPPLLRELQRLGAGPDEVELLCATGTHRPASGDELVGLVGPEVAHRYQVHNHVATDANHVEVGTVDATPILIDRRWVEADVRITTGFVEPHFFAGFSGGPKGVCPGLAALETVLEAHSPARIADARASWTVLEGNPVHDFVRAAAALAPPHLSLDVAINGARRITAVFAGPVDEAHPAACRFVEETAVRRVPGRFDVVVSTNGGYPLDRNLYQAVKGMAAAERVVGADGTIVMAAACVDGVPGDGAFGRLVAAAGAPSELVDAGAPRALDRWQAQVLGRVLGRARVLLHADGLSDAEIQAAHLEPLADVTEGIREAVTAAGRVARVCVLPYGPLTVATPA